MRLGWDQDEMILGYNFGSYIIILGLIVEYLASWELEDAKVLCDLMSEGLINHLTDLIWWTELDTVKHFKL